MFKKILNFFRQIISSKWNNWVLLILWIIMGLLFINALYQGGGEPLGFKALREIGDKPAQISDAAKYYYLSAKHFAPEALTPSAPIPVPAETWFWWKLWLMSLAAAILFIPFAFWDEVVNAWHWTQERHEQRRFITNRIKEDDGVTDGKTPTIPKLDPRLATPWGRFKERVAAVISAELIFDFAGNLAKRIIGDRIIKGLK